MVKRLRLFARFAGATLCALSGPAHAEALGEAAREAVVELCPELLTIETPLADDPRIKARGFSADGTRQHPRAGTLDVVSKKFGDGEIWIANSREGSFCQVGMRGNGAVEAFEAFLEKPGFYADDLFPDPAKSVMPTGVKTHEFRTPTEDGFYYGIQFVDLRGANPDAPLIIQQYAIEEE